MHVPVIDHGATDAPELFVRSLKETGFAVFVNHPVPTQLVEAVYSEWYDFFHSEDKQTYLFTERQDGYYPPSIAETAKGADKRDLKEFFHVYDWGQYPAGLSDSARTLREHGKAFATQLLGWVEEHTPAEVTAGLSMPLSKMMEGSTRTLLRILHYPPMHGDEEAGAVRAAAHEDINLITVLPGSPEPGLQVKDTAGNWHDVAANPGTIVINAGDMLQLATKGYYPSTTHRVMNPVGEGRFRSRMSTPIFLHPADDVQLSPEKTAYEYLQERIRELRVTAPPLAPSP
jgi:isopenicillin N synthase-like dioxygenase